MILRDIKNSIGLRFRLRDDLNRNVDALYMIIKNFDKLECINLVVLGASWMGYCYSFKISDAIANDEVILENNIAEVEEQNFSKNSFEW